MTTEPDFTAAPPSVRTELRVERYRSSGYAEGWQWIREVEGDPEALRHKAAEIEARFNNPDRRQSMAPGASPRLYQEGFLRALTTALGHIEAAPGRGEPERSAR